MNACCAVFLHLFFDYPSLRDRFCQPYHLTLLSKLSGNTLGLFESKVIYYSSAGIGPGRVMQRVYGCVGLLQKTSALLSCLIYKAAIWVFAFEELSNLVENWLFSVCKKIKQKKPSF